MTVVVNRLCVVIGAGVLCLLALGVWVIDARGTCYVACLQLDAYYEQSRTYVYEDVGVCHWDVYDIYGIGNIEFLTKNVRKARAHCPTPVCVDWDEISPVYQCDPPWGEWEPTFCMGSCDDS